MTTSAKIALTDEIRERVDRWLQFSSDEEEKKEIRRLLAEEPQKLIDAFYRNLSFGTGGMRGVIGVGTNRMNRTIVQKVTQGVCNYLKSSDLGGEKPLKACIAYDSRHHSADFAKSAAKVFAGNDIEVHIFRELRPTPLLSFACRELGCHVGLMITASHNPPNYNGYKLYWKGGGQVLAPHDEGVVAAANAIQTGEEIRQAPIDDSKVHWLGEEIDQAYYQATLPLQISATRNQSLGKDLSIVFSGLHGTGSTMVPQLLAGWGFTTLFEVDEQREPDGDFPSVLLPNPEEAEALSLGIALLEEKQADLLLVTDPDADRVGVAVRHKGEVVRLTGNQIACLAADYLLENLQEQERLPENGGLIKTIVTSELFTEICAFYGCHCVDVLTGFKYVAEKIDSWETSGSYQFLFGGEESYGYLLGTHARDKDAVICCGLLSEIALEEKMTDHTLIDRLERLYQKYGVYCEELHAIVFPETRAGRQKMEQQLARLRQTPPHSFAGDDVEVIEDYQTSTAFHIAESREKALTLPKSDVLLFRLASGAKVIVRPSGTEPKVKVYVGVREVVAEKRLELAQKKAEQRAKAMLDEMRRVLETS